MKKVVFIRHAKSSWDFPELKDFDRPLNARGKRDAPMMAALVKQEGFKPDKIVSSPARRALTTAEVFADTFGIPSADILKVERIYEATPQTLMGIIRELSDAWETVFIYGHNPTFTQVVNLFTNRYIDNVPTCGVCLVTSTASAWEEFHPENSRLEQLFFPRDYRK